MQVNDRQVYLLGERLRYNLETNGIRRTVHEATGLLG